MQTARHSPAGQIALTGLPAFPTAWRSRVTCSKIGPRRGLRATASPPQTHRPETPEAPGARGAGIPGRKVGRGGLLRALRGGSGRVLGKQRGGNGEAAREKRGSSARQPQRPPGGCPRQAKARHGRRRGAEVPSMFCSHEKNVAPPGTERDASMGWDACFMREYMYGLISRRKYRSLKASAGSASSIAQLDSAGYA